MGGLLFFFVYQSCSYVDHLRHTAAAWIQKLDNSNASPQKVLVLCPHEAQLMTFIITNTIDIAQQVLKFSCKSVEESSKNQISPVLLVLPSLLVKWSFTPLLALKSWTQEISKGKLWPLNLVSFDCIQITEDINCSLILS